MYYKLYLGSLELHIISDIVLLFYEFDALFKEKVLPVTAIVTIYIKHADPNWNFTSWIQKGKYLQLCQQGGIEYRLYTGKREKGIASMYNPAKNEVHVFLTKEYTFEENHFRPWFQIHLEDLLLHNHALVLHSASINHAGQAILFCAPSGTGKTTQTNLWHKYKHDVSDINGDRTLVQLYNDHWYACGFPIYGSSVRCVQCCVPLRMIVLLKQSNTNYIKKINDREKFMFLYKEISKLSYNRDHINICLDLTEKLIQEIEIIELNCTISEEAVTVLYDYIMEKTDYETI